jgi:asparagine synthase (glutamine-hydrolysing)
LRKQFEGKYNFQTESDCEVILALYKGKGHFIDEMNGIFGFAIYDVDKDEYFVARDHMGIIPLYIGWDQHGTLCGFRTESIRRILYKNTTVSSWTLYDK